MITTFWMSSSLSASIAVAVLDVGRVERVDPVAEQSQRADVVRLAAHGEEIAADVRVGAVDGVLDLRERDVVLVEQSRVDQDLVLLDGAAVPGHVDHAGDPPAARG